MARGIHHAAMINTVSPTYAREIMTPGGGAGLDNLLRARSFDVHGILNGIDTEVWDPATDVRLPVHYDVERLDERAAAKRALQEALGLPQRPDVPLLGMVSRLAWQKGLDIMGHPLHMLLNGYAGDVQVVVLGTGEPEYETMLAHLANYHGEKMRAVLSFSDDLAALIYAGSDMFLMPSRFEPCGLGQLIAMRYGSVPVVRETGGLVDTVQDSVTGFTFRQLNSQDFWQALQRAIYVYNVNRPHWRNIQTNGMRSNYSWERAAAGYAELYAWAEARVRGN
jgi:starch synthase